MKSVKSKIKDFDDLEAWKSSHLLVIDIYKLTRDFPKTETFGLTSQLRRAAVSITSNIAEGFGRKSVKEKIQFYYVAQASMNEFKNQLIISRDIEYLDLNKFNGVISRADRAHMIIRGLIRKTKTFTNKI